MILDNHWLMEASDSLVEEMNWREMLRYSSILYLQYPSCSTVIILTCNIVEVYHAGVWGGVCDDEWDLSEAGIVCRVLGYPGAETATHGGKFGYSPATIWMDNMYCYGTEKRLEKCRQGLYNTG